MLFFKKLQRKKDEETQKNTNFYQNNVSRENNQFSATDLFDDSESETTLLSEYPDETDGETEDNNDDEYEYEGQTSLLSEELSPYLHPEQYDYPGNQRKNAWESSGIYNEKDKGATTLLSSKNNSVVQGMYLPETAPKAYLIQIIKSEKTYVNNMKFIVGSGTEDVDCLIENNSVSRKHAFIIYSNGDYYIIDNKSTNKTLLDGAVLEPLKPVKLYHGALIQFSDELFQFVCN